MLKIKKEDTIIDILKKMDKEKSNEIKLDFPFGHPILHNQLSLKILKTKAKNKKLYIISNDKTAKKISKLLGINFIKSKDKIANKITHNILKENYTFLEYAKFEIKTIGSKIKRLIQGNLQNNKKINTIFYLQNKYGKNNKNIILYFIIILTLILFLLFYIFYIAINKTIITIYPENIIQTKSKNFTFIEGDINDNTYINNKIKINKINKKIFLTKTIGTSGIKQEENNLSKGKVVFFNYLLSKAYILKNTTLENKEGIQFYLPKDITIPAGIKKDGKIIPGKINAEIFGKIKLLNGDYSGLKTNIETGVLLTIPKLRENKTKIFAKSITKFNGGSNNFIKYLTKEDLENAKKLLENNLKKSAIKAIQKEIEESNKRNSIKVEILPIDNIFKFTNLSIKIPEHIKIGDKINNFKISGEIEITSYTYNKQEVISFLKNSINETLIKDSFKIISIDEKQLRIAHIIKRNDLKKINGKYIYAQKMNFPFMVKATTEIEYLISKKFTNKNSTFINQIKNSILGKDIKIAEKILINKNQINNVKIEVKPFFINHISKLPENIKILIKN